MKRFFTHLILFTALMLCSASSWAQLMVCGHSVDLNATSTQTISGSNISGTVTYNPSNKTLTLDNATLTSSGMNDGIYNQGVEGLTILFRGTVKITTNSDDATVAALYCDKRTILTSPGNASAPVITLKNIGNGPAIKVRGAVLHAYGDNISATAANYHAVIGDVYNSGTEAALYMHFSILEAKGASGYRAVTGFTGGLSMAESILGTEGASFDETSGSIVNSSNTALQEATIIPALTIGTLYIGDNGTRTITAAKTGATTASGNYTYNSSTKTLTLTDFNIDGTNIISHIPGLTIDFQGGGTLTNSGIAMDLYGNTKLTSDGKVVITGTSSSAIFLNGDYDLEVSMPEFQATSASGGDGINGNNDRTNSGGRLIMTKYNDESVYKFLGTRSNLRVGSIVLNDMDLWSTHTYHNPANKTMYHYGVEACGTSQDTDATWFKSTNQFTYYDLYVAGTHVNNRNRKDIVNSSIKSGKISYDSGSKTLTLDGVTMEVSDDDRGVRSFIQDLNIVLNGTNKMTTNNDLFYLAGNTTFSGSGNLEATSKEKHGISTDNGANVTIATTSYFAIHAEGYGYWGYGYENETLTLKKTSDDDFGYAFDGSNGALYDIPNLVLDGMAISNSAWPGLVGCYFEDGMIMQNGGYIAKGYVAFKSIKERTGIYVAGQEIVRVNDPSYPIYVGSPYIQSGTKSVAYAPDTKTLTLTDATIDYQGSDGNFYDIRFDLNVTANIVVKGNNTLTGNEKMFAPLWLRSGSNITASGDGTLNLLNGPLYLYNSSFIAQDNVGINCNQSYIGSNNTSSPGQLAVRDNAVITAQKINLISALDLSANHAITTPAGAEFKDNGVYVGSSLAQNVVIQPTDYTGIDELRTGNDESGIADLSDAEIYDLSGRRISQLQPGINVIRTKDGKVYKINKK